MIQTEVKEYQSKVTKGRATLASTKSFYLHNEMFQSKAVKSFKLPTVIVLTNCE